MRRRLAALLAAVAFGALGISACGGSPQPSSALDDALGYFPRDAPFVAAVETDPDGDQIKQTKSLLGRFSLGGLLAGRLERMAGFRSIDYERDVRPQLGAPLVIGLPRPAVRKAIAKTLVAAMRVKHPIRVRQALLRQPGMRGDGKSSGTRIYEDRRASRYAAVDGDALVVAASRSLLEQALAMHRSGKRMHEAGFDRDLGGLPDGALVRASADPRAMIGADRRLLPALSVKWIASMRRLGATLKAYSDGVALDFRLVTDAGSLTAADLPLAPKGGAIPLIGRKDELQVGVREPWRLARFAAAVWRAIAPSDAARARKLEPQGVDLEHQLPRHLADVAVLAIDPLSRAFAARATLHDPADVRTGIQAVAPVLPDIGAVLGVPALGVATPQPGESFYALAKPSGKTVVFGVVGNTLVAASDASRAADLASEPTHTAPAPKAAAVVTADARQLAAKLLGRQLGGAAALAAPLLVSGLRDLTGWLVIARAGLRGHLKLTVAR